MISTVLRKERNRSIGTRLNSLRSRRSSGFDLKFERARARAPAFSELILTTNRLRLCTFLEYYHLSIREAQA